MTPRFRRAVVLIALVAMVMAVLLGQLASLVH
jgi:hypothetical protein